MGTIQPGGQTDETTRRRFDGLLGSDAHVLQAAASGPG